MITSPDNPKVRYARRLGDRGFRRREGRIVVEGVRLTADALEAGLEPAFVLASEGLDRTGAGRRLREALAATAAPLLPASPAALVAAADTVTPQGVVAVFPTPRCPWPVTLGLVVVADGIQDPGNMGTLLRTAAAAGADGAVLAPGSVDAFNPKALRAGMGAQFRLPVRGCPAQDVPDLLAGLQVVVADAGGAVEYTAVDWRAPSALVIGSEGRGASEALRSQSTTSAQIPLARGTESLNAAAAAAVMLFEAARQRRPG